MRLGEGKLPSAVSQSSLSAGLSLIRSSSVMCKEVGGPNHLHSRAVDDERGWDVC